MLASRTVCAQCRPRLLPSATTLATIRPSSTAILPAATATANPTRPTAQPGQARPYNTPPKRSTNGDQRARQRALDLFEETISSEPRASPVATTQDANQFYRLADELDKITQNKRGLPAAVVAAESYELLSTRLLPALRASGSPLPKVVKTKAALAVHQIANLKFANIDNADLPSTADLCKVYADLGNLRVVKRLELINSLLRAIVSSPSESGTRCVEERLLDDLVECWKHFSGMRRAHSGLASEAKFWLTTRPDMRGVEQPVKLFRALFPLFAVNELQGSGAALVTTFVLLSESRHTLTRAKEEAQPLLEALDPIVKRFDQEMLRQMFEGHPELWSHVQPRADWRVTRMAPEAWKEPGTPPVEGSSSRRPRSPGLFSYAQWHKRFDVAFRSNNHAAAQQAWRDLIDPANDVHRAQRLRDSPELLDYILFLACSKWAVDAEGFSKMTANVLAYMREVESAPTIRTYTSMMKGWKQARRLDPIEKLWASITASRVRLDEHIWTTRIAALGHLSHERAGLAALKEMETVWNTAVKEGTQSTAVEPGIASVNAAISGLLKQDRMEVIRAVLAWAIERGIQPNIFTYNMLLARMLKKGASDEADRILSSMRGADLTPDAATFTIILEAALEDLPDQTPAEQRETIDKVFSEMAACGIKPNQEAFAKVLHVLVKAGDVAEHSVAAVLAQLRSAGMQPSTEICTILVEFYASRERPDLDSLRALVADRRSRTRALTDRVFWESVIKHYHRAGDLDSALEIVYDLDDWGIWPALPLLEPLLRSLIGRRDWDGAKMLVDTVRKQPRPQAAEGNKDGRYWNHGFWAAAKDHQLI
ncbi:Pentatricopeptide repeat-containing protein [Colletotrichum tanaceti]|uniref:Pentatricopeptide repeat-containing protein n=1 Tax=Colletotrichum tanaceti TaxID=1306861 RepID=A0A4U6X8R7_9PEZI|nr:Pentatricopeptide repeat-containing protein [Colletotrichum tanaceti]TKW51950.1 Pentatricopeptide repeat-containing protein [Colletotrichum tanaceti]